MSQTDKRPTKSKFYICTWNSIFLPKTDAVQLIGRVGHGVGGPGAQLGPSPGGRRLEWTRLERRQGGDLEGGKENQRTGRAAKGPPAGAAKGPLQRERTKNKTWMPAAARYLRGQIYQETKTKQIYIYIYREGERNIHIYHQNKHWHCTHQRAATLPNK